MRLLILCTVISLTGMHANAQRIRLSLNNATFKEFITAVEEQTTFSFIYTSEQLARLPRVTINDSADLFRLLQRKLQHSTVGFTIEGNFIVLISKKNSHSLKGKIVDRDTRPVEGISIQTLSGETIALTDAQGLFSLQSIAADSRLVISGAEIETAVIKVEGREYLEIRVKDLIRELEETVVPGYGSIKKRFNTGNIVKLNMTSLPSSATGNLLTTLQARAAGLLVTVTGGAPSSSYLMQIRGQHSINPNPLINYRIPPVDQPLIIIDGVPFAPQNNNVNQLTSLAAPGNLEFYQNPYGGISPFSVINPEMIESVEILKDAVSTSIYGSRAANGIILINTRKPKGDEFSIETSVSLGLNLISSRPVMLDVKDYLNIRQAAFKTSGLQPDLAPGSAAYAPDLLKFEHTRQTDWSKYFFSAAAPFFNMNATAQGLIGRIHFLSGITLRQEKYLLKGDFFSQQFSFNNNLEFTSKDNRLKVQATTIMSHGWNFSLASASLLEAIRLPPNYPSLYDNSGKINWNSDGVDLSDNPAALLRQTYNIGASNVLISPRISYKFSKAITATVNAGYSGFTTGEQAIFPGSSFPDRNQRNARSFFADTRYHTKLVEPQLAYKTSLGRFQFTALSGLTLQQNDMRLASKKGTQYKDETLMSSIEKAGRIDERSIEDSYRYTSLFNSVDMQYANKYLFQFSARHETSSRFAEGSKAGKFSSIGLGWIFSEESFIKNNLRWLNFAKLRGSYGSTGNDNVGYYHYLTAWVQNPTYSGSISSAGLSEASVSWSVTHKSEAGLELRMLNDRLILDVSAYKHHSTDQLISEISSTQPGRVRYLTQSPSVVENKGIEIIATFLSNPKSISFWTSQINVTLPSNKLKSFPAIENSLYSSLYWPNRSLNTVDAIHYTGINETTGFYSFDEQKVSFFNTAPRLYGGWNNKLKFKNWTFELLFEFKVQTGINYLKQISDHHAGERFNLPITFATRSTPHGLQLQQPALADNLEAMLSTFNLSVSDMIFSDASYFKIRSFGITYKISKGHLKSTTLYMQLQNMLTITSFKLTDPEIGSFYSYPYSGCISAGMHIRL